MVVCAKQMEIVTVPISSVDLDATQLQELYRWIDKIPLSKPKKNIARDFSDGVLMAEVVAHFFPKSIELHNYSKSNAETAKLDNWNVLNKKTFRKMGFQVAANDITDVVACKKGTIEKLLYGIQLQMLNCQENAMSKFQENAERGKAEPDARSGRASDGGRQSRGERDRGGSNSNNSSPTGSGERKKKDKDKEKGERRKKDKLPAPHTHLSPHGQGEMDVPMSSAEKDAVIADLRETVEILQLKVTKLEQLVALKNTKIQALNDKLDSVEMY